MRNNFFFGAVVRIHDSQHIPSMLRGVRVVIISREPEKTNVGPIWRARNSNGIEIWINQHGGMVVHPEGSRPANISMEQLLRTCHVDPAILRPEGT